MIYGRRGLVMFAISGIEIALWDLLGKVRQAPVCALLGGAVRLRLPVYASLLRCGFRQPPDTTYITHGETTAAAALRDAITG